MITFAKHVNDKLIFLACYKVFPYAPVFETFSDPAKSTMKSLLTLACSVIALNWLRVNWKIRWDRDEVLFILVAVVALFLWAMLTNLKS